MPHPADEEVLDSPVYWFVVMENAKRRGEFLRAQQALDQLRRLGVLVRFVRPPGPHQGGPNHAA